MLHSTVEWVPYTPNTGTIWFMACDESAINFKHNQFYVFTCLPWLNSWYDGFYTSANHLYFDMPTWLSIFSASQSWNGDLSMEFLYWMGRLRYDFSKNKISIDIVWTPYQHMSSWKPHLLFLIYFWRTSSNGSLSSLGIELWSSQSGAWVKICNDSCSQQSTLAT